MSLVSAIERFLNKSTDQLTETKVVSVVLGQCGRLKYACCVCGGDVYGVHCRHTFSVLQKKLQVITTSGSTFKPHPVSMRLTNACQQAILSGDVSAVQEELAIGYTGRAEAIATAAHKKTPLGMPGLAHTPVGV